MSMAESIAQRRLPKELKLLAEAGTYKVSLVQDNIRHWAVVLPPPPKDSPYAGGTFCVDVRFPDAYPNTPPELRFTTPIYSPSIDPEGRPCERILDGWQPSHSVAYALETISSVFVVYDLGVVNTEAAALAQSDRRSFEEKARQFTRRHAAAS